MAKKPITADDVRSQHSEWRSAMPAAGVPFSISLCGNSSRLLAGMERVTNFQAPFAAFQPANSEDYLELEPGARQSFVGFGEAGFRSRMCG